MKIRKNDDRTNTHQKTQEHRDNYTMKIGVQLIDNGGRQVNSKVLLLEVFNVFFCSYACV